MVRQQMVCLVTPHWPGHADLVRSLAGPLDEVLESLDCVHFASLALLPPLPAAPGVPAAPPAPPQASASAAAPPQAPASAAGSGQADGSPAQHALPSLMFELAVDEGLDTPLLLERLVARGLETLWPLYGGYAEAALASAPRAARAAWLQRWLRANAYGADGGYVGARDRSVAQVRQEQALYRGVRARAAEITGGRPMDSRVLARELSLWASARTEYDWAHTAAPRCFWRRGGLRRLLLGAVALALLLLAGAGASALLQGLCRAWPALCPGWTLLWPSLLLGTAAVTLLLGLAGVALLPLALALATALRRLGRAVSTVFMRWDRARHARSTREVPRAHQVHPLVAQGEAQLVNRVNHMISLTEIRSPTGWHAAWLRCWLGLITWVGRWAFPHGMLGLAVGVKFGHWHLIENGRRLLFCSNFDGSFGGYLGEFISGATVGVNLFWRRTCLLPRPAAAPGHPAVTHARDFPPTRVLSWRGGCEHEQWFKAYARDSMLPHLYLYQAYALSHAEIERATQLRDALFGPRNAVNDDMLAKAVES